MINKKHLSLLSVFIFTSIIGFVVFQNFTKTADALGDLLIVWKDTNGAIVPSGDPIFNIDDTKPGDMYTATVEVTNTTVFDRTVGVKGLKTAGLDQFADVLELIISESGNDLYGGTSPGGAKTFGDFFDDSLSPFGISLFTLGPGETVIFTFETFFPASSGNIYQLNTLTFDITIGTTIEIPQECSGITFDGEIIIGTAGNDKLDGKQKNDLIIGLEGNDKIDGEGGDDCIVGGMGNDKLRGGSGNDSITGNEGNDKIDGGSGNDTINGRDGNDDIDAGTGDDFVVGGIGNDKIEGSRDNDILHGGDGNDHMDGGSGLDQLFGEANNDTMKGGSDNDTLIGGTDIDNANGQTGTDTCDAEVESNCEL